MPLVSKKKKVDIKNKAEETLTASASRRKVKKGPGSSRTAYYIVAAVVVVALAVFGVAYYQTYVAPFRRAIITVDGTVVVRMGTFLERAKISGSSGMGTLQPLTNEYLIKQGAPRYGISVTPEDIDRELRARAAGSDNVTIGDAEFKEWYRQLLNDSKVSDGRYREMVGSSLLASRLQEYMALQIPDELEHAHVYAISVGTYEEAAKVKERVDAGEDFGELARELSMDPNKEKDGEIGWFPKGATVGNNKYDPFYLQAGAVSDPMAMMEDPTSTEPPSFYYVLMVEEFAVRQVEAEFLPEVRATAFQDWLNAEMDLHTIRWGGWDGKDNNSYGSETDAWVNWQLSKDKPKS
ncbi:MAG: hypothetical protein A2147_10455 [Chloroflexi bacterium RBG_16_57_8]|nr:MAG: hypothetical protein A2147_10455 [Chloroflexi bacterium RBG_16_57_8]